MAVRKILTVPDPVLKQVSTPVEAVDDELRALLDDMLETMYDAPGVGLAAIQVGVPVRALVMDVSAEGEGPAPRYFVNPEIVWHSEELSSYQEGCLSVPEQYADVDRPAEVRVSFLDYDGQPQEMHASGLLATCIQHELDHLNGVLFIDHLSRMKRDMIVRKLTKARKAEAAE
ncbi:MAG: peptide deformylase [Alphaproteobacteria bacterium]|nr:peptide deformylase [Alphaproteobacteria bacterium]